MEKLNKKALIAVVAILAIAAVAWWALLRDRLTGPGHRPTSSYEQDTTLEGDVTISRSDRVLLKNGARLIVNGNLTVEGVIYCDGGPVMVVVDGDLKVNGSLLCERRHDLPDEDSGLNIAIVVTGSVEFSDTANVITDGSVFLTDSPITRVDDEASRARIREQLDALYDDAAKDSGTGLRVGPFIEIPLAPGQSASLLPVPGSNATLVSDGKVSLVSTLHDAIFTPANAQTPARDESGNLVPNTVRIGGTWVVGDPTAPPPADIKVERPPKPIRKVIVAYKFGEGKDINLVNLSVSGPHGSYGRDSQLEQCIAFAGKGGDAWRMNVSAPNVKINNFTLNLGWGGDGGIAQSKTDCEHGQATGGEGGEPGNFKIVGTKSFDITGTFQINPGQGGAGGHAIAHGKDGKPAACTGEPGGKATATGGKGGDNKKGVKVEGTVTGIANVSISNIIAGLGGTGVASSGDGADGAKCGCDGGAGGTATATGGKGGTATSRNVPSIGGNGGNANTIPGKGGKGGSCGPDKTGGTGGKGGDAIAKAGKAGTGRTANGVDGTIQDQTGGNGGNGGDGCREGKGGAGGAGQPAGQNGKDGKNLCVITNTNTPPPPPPPQTPPPPPETDPISVTPGSLSQTHMIGESSCPQNIGSLSVGGTPGTWTVSGAPAWMNIARSGSTPGSLSVSFNCNISNFTTHTEQATLTFTAADGSKDMVGVTMNVKAE